MKKYLLFSMVLTFLISGCGSETYYENPDEMVSEALEVVDMIGVEELHKLMIGEEYYTLIDVRQKSEHYHGYIPGSLVIPRGSLEFVIGNEAFWEEEGLYMPLKDEKIVVYCRKGSRGILAAQTLKQLGYKDVYALDGGWKKWEVTYPDIFEKNLEMLQGGTEEHKEDIGGC